MKYMKEDYVGAASRILYAKQGDEVEIIREETATGLLFVQAKNGNKFHIFSDILSDEPVKPVCMPSRNSVLTTKSKTRLKPRSKK